MKNPNPTLNPTLNETLDEFDAGIFMTKATEALKLAALGVVATGKKGGITIQLDLERIGDGSSVQIKHTLKYTKPTANGKLVEENATTTPMYVDNLGYLSINRQLHEDLFNADQPTNVTSIRKK